MEHAKITYADAMKVVVSTIEKCERMQNQFALGTSQYTLLKNRIHALQVGKAILNQENINAQYHVDELQKAMAPLVSIQHKCKKAQAKYEKGTYQFQRYVALLDTMELLIGELQTSLDTYND